MRHGAIGCAVCSCRNCGIVTLTHRVSYPLESAPRRWRPFSPPRQDQSDWPELSSNGLRRHGIHTSSCSCRRGVRACVRGPKPAQFNWVKPGAFPFCARLGLTPFFHHRNLPVNNTKTRGVGRRPEMPLSVRARVICYTIQLDRHEPFILDPVSTLA
jgi:hypothetical protein